MPWHNLLLSLDPKSHVTARKEPYNGTAYCLHTTPDDQHFESFQLHFSDQLSFTALSSSSKPLTPSSSDDKADSPCSTHSSQSTRQLCPRLPMAYNESALMKLYGRPQIQMLNSISIPLPLNDSNEEESPVTSNSYYAAEESPTNYKPKDEESPMTPSSADTQQESPMTSSSSADNKQDSPVTNAQQQWPAWGQRQKWKSTKLSKTKDFRFYKDTLSQN